MLYLCFDMYIFCYRGSISITYCSVYFVYYIHCDRRGCVEVERSSCVSEIGVRSPVGTDPTHKNRSWKLHCQTLVNRRLSRVLRDAHYKRMPRVTVGGTLKNPHCSMAMSAKHRSKFAAFNRQWWRLHMSEKFSSGTINSKTNKKVYSLLSCICTKEQQKHQEQYSSRFPQCELRFKSSKVSIFLFKFIFYLAKTLN